MTYTFKKPARPVNRVFVHCSASDNPAHDNVATMDAWHKERGWSGVGYHYFIRKDGTLEIGRDLAKIPAAQEGNNTGTIAICLHGLLVEKFTGPQFETLRALCSQINAAYSPLLTFHGHCEVANKTCPVFDYRAVLGLDAKGRLTEVARKLDLTLKTAPSLGGSGLEVMASNAVSLTLGSQGSLVKNLQLSLARLGYFAGAVDGDFGARTQAAVLAFQAENHLIPDGAFGTLSREAMAVASPRAIAPARAMATLASLSAGGSRIASASIANTIVGSLVGGGGALAVVDQMTGLVSQITGQSDAIEKLFMEHGLLGGGVILAAGAFIAWQSWRAGQARVEDHRTGKTA
jgi:N-acetyl-anhydromuramyl-L-alanine amidase AmpD